MIFPPCAAIESLRGSNLPMDRSLFYMDGNVSYMNAATLGPMARPALECAVKSWEYLESDPHNNYLWGGPDDSALDAVRLKAADMLGCFENEVTFTPSTTVAMNLIGEGLVATGHLRPSDYVLTTDQEHRGGVAVWEHWVKMKKLGGIDRVRIPVGEDLTPSGILDAFQQHINRAKEHGTRYSVVSVSHVLTTTGARMPLPELAQLAHKEGALFVVDGAQGPGNIAVNLHEAGADAYTVSAHKWLLAPTGSGLLYIKRGAPQETIQPAQLSGGYMAYSDHAGTVPLQTIAGLGYALDLMNVYGGLEAVESHGIHMANKTRTALLQQLSEQVTVLSPSPSSGAESSIVTIALPPFVSNTVVTDRLKAEFGVIVKKLPGSEGGSKLTRNCIRVSHHVYTSESDVDRFVNGLSTILTDSTC